MKWLAMIFSFILGQLKSGSVSPSLIFIQKALEKSRSLVFLATASFVSALLLVAGIVIAAVNGFSQYDQTNQVYMSATFVGGLVIALLSGIGLAVVFSKKNWQVPDLRSTIIDSKAPSPIEEAIALLVNDFVSARRGDRENKSSTQPFPQNASQAPTQRTSEKSESPFTSDQVH